MTKRKLLLVFLIQFCFTATAGLFAQKNKIQISGFVKDSLDKPIANCLIFADNKKRKTKTNSKGFYTLKLKHTPKKITFFSPKHGFTDVKYLNHKHINITFKKKGVHFDQNNYSDKFSEEKKPLAYKYPDIYSYLRGRVTGVQVYPDKTIIIRGSSSLLGSSKPLFVLNDIAIDKDDIENINLNDIKEVKVIKGGDATKYGIRGTAGVITITTY